jgi:hypothetical protein
MVRGLGSPEIASMFLSLHPDSNSNQALRPPPAKVERKIVFKLMNCPACRRLVASNAPACPNCGHDFAKERHQQAVAYGVIAVILVVALAVAAFLILLPGILINTVRGRYKNRERNLVLQSIRDPQTWLISLPIAAITFLLLHALAVFGPAPKSSSSTGSAPTSYPTAETDVPTVVTPPPRSADVYATAVPAASAIDLSYTVAGVAASDALNVRSGPDARYPITERLSNGLGGIHVLGAPVINGTTVWVKISRGGRPGWVNKAYLILE